MSSKDARARRRGPATSSLLATLADNVSALEQAVTLDRQHTREANQLIHLKLAGLASSIEALQIVAGENRQAIIQQNRLIENLAQTMVLRNGQAHEQSPAGLSGVSLAESAPEALSLDRLKEIDRDILRAASFTTPYMGKQLASCTKKYKFNPYFRSRLSFLYKKGFLKRSGEGYLLAAPGICST